MKIIKLYPRENSKFHFGHLGLDIDDNIFHSDSLFSTIVINYIRKFGTNNLEEFIRVFPKISSLFYGVNNGKYDILFIPIFIGFNFNKNLLEMDRKLPKKIKFISLNLLKDSSEIEVNRKRNIAFSISDNIQKDFELFTDELEEKVKIDRETMKAEEEKLYSISYIRPTKGTFFYFLLDGQINREFEISLQLIKNFGLGGEISCGSGIIEEIKIEDFEELKLIKGDRYINLSIVFPKKEEFDKIEKYKLIERKGWVYLDTKRKRNILALAEGSLFKDEIEGEIREEKIGNKKIYRYGKSFNIPVVIENE